MRKIYPLFVLLAIFWMAACSGSAEPTQVEEMPVEPTVVAEPTVVVEATVLEGQSVAKQEVTDPMAAYQSSLPYRIRHEDYVSTDLLAGFTPVRSLVMNPDGVQFPNPPADLSAYVQDFVDVDGIWGPPIAGYNDGFNDVCTDIHGWCSDDIQAWNWRIYTGYEIKHPAVGTLRDPNGGAVALLVINRHDSDEVWNVRNNSGVYVDSGFVGYGPFWFNTDQEGLEEQVPHLLWHYLAQLTQPHPDNHLEGQCGSSALCDSVTWVVVYRSWDRPDLEVDYAHYQLVGWGRYRP